MLYRLLVAALIAMSASVTSAAPAALDAGDALDARMAKLEAKLNELEFVDKEEEHGVKEQRGGRSYARASEAASQLRTGLRGGIN